MRDFSNIEERRLQVMYELQRDRLSLLGLPGKVCAKRHKRKCQEIVESKLKDGQCGFCPDRSTMKQIFGLKQFFEKSWEYVKNLCKVCRSGKNI